MIHIVLTEVVGAVQIARQLTDAAAEEPERTEPRFTTPGPQEGSERPWWRRVFGS